MPVETSVTVLSGSPVQRSESIHWAVFSRYVAEHDLAVIVEDGTAWFMSSLYLPVADHCR